MPSSTGLRAATPPLAQRIVPQLAYRDIAAAIAWLARCFGFRERSEARFVARDGVVGHAEMELAGAVFHLGSDGGHGLSSPANDTGRSQMLCVYVDDVERHFERARAAGAPVLTQLEDTFWGDRRYQVHDLEGHVWAFHQRVREVRPEDWPTQAG